MIPSNYNLICPINHYQYSSIIINFLVMHFDFLTKVQNDFFKRNLVFTEKKEHLEIPEFLYKRGYAYPDYKVEAQILEVIKTNIRETYSKEPYYYFIVPSYNCNLSCINCPYSNLDRQSMNKEQIDEVFNFIKFNKSQFTDIPHFLLIGGGEPLLERENFEYIFNKAKELELSIQVITNGININNYIELLKEYRDNLIIAIKLPAQEHISEDFLDGIDMVLDNKIFVNFHLGVNKQTLKHAVKMANNITHRMWLYLKNFKAFIVSMKDNMCNCPYLNPIDNELLQNFIDLRREYPQLELFLTNGWHGIDLIDYWIGEKTLPIPRFYKCKNQLKFLAFTPDNLIYKCFESLGKKEYSIGSYYPEFNINIDKERIWQVKTEVSKKCLGCCFYPLCGGGCPKLELENYEPLFNLPDCKTFINSIKLCVKNYSNELIEIFTNLNKYI